MARRRTVGVVGGSRADPGSELYEAARSVGRLAVDGGFRIVTGGLSGVMEAASRGAHESGRYREGDTVGILPHAGPDLANRWVDIAVATGMHHARNVLVANSDAVIAVGGEAGTLSEIALAWAQRRLVVALRIDGWARRLADAPLDDRIRYPDIPDDRIFGADSPEEAVAVVAARIDAYGEHGGAFSTPSEG